MSHITSCTRRGRAQSYITNVSSGVAHLAHLAGALFGYLLILLRFRINAIRVFFPRRY